MVGFCKSSHIWTLSTMMSKDKSGGDSVGTLYRESMARLVFL